MATTIRVIARLESASGLPEDDAINVWHWWCLASDPADAFTDINAGLQTFYASISEDLFNENTLAGNITYKYYDLLDSEPRSVINTETQTGMTLGDADALPTECSICMSFGGAPGSGLNFRRRNGRVYLGPLGIGPASTVAGNVVVSPLALTLIADAGVELIAAGGVTAAWSVFSPTTAGTMPWNESILESATTWVTQGWIDNAFDTQRRRGTVASSRTTFGG